MPSEHTHRRAALAEHLRSVGLAGAWITDLVNVRYLTGFTGSNGAALVTADETCVLVSDGRYTTQAAAESPDVDRLTDRDLVGAVLTAEALPAGTIGVETHALTQDAYAVLVPRLASAGHEAVSLARAVETLRVVKDDVELAALRTACEISTAALEALWSTRVEGRTERELTRTLESTMLDLGAEAVAFDTILASGPHSAIPHHTPTDRVVERGDLLKIDFGARVEGYHADCTRTAVVGPPADWQREIHAAVRDAQRTGVEALVAGAPVADADRLPREVLDAAGWLEHFTTGIGHGVGLVIHEDPFISAKHVGTLADRTPVTMEPGIYLPDRGGVRIEDTLVVGPGSPTVLTTATTDLVEIS